MRPDDLRQTIVKAAFDVAYKVSNFILIIPYTSLPLIAKMGKFHFNIFFHISAMIIIMKSLHLLLFFRGIKKKQNIFIMWTLVRFYASMEDRRKVNIIHRNSMEWCKEVSHYRLLFLFFISVMNHLISRYVLAFLSQPLCKEGKVSLVEYNPLAFLVVSEAFYFPLTHTVTWPLVQDDKSTFPNT